MDYITQKMKVHPNETLRQNILRKIQHVDDCIQEYRNNKGCLYWILVLDTNPLAELQKRMKKLRAEYASLE